MELTKEQIERDIEDYGARLGKAKAKLNDLPQQGNTWKERNRIRLARRALLSEIQLLKTMIGYARQALAEVVD
jgi:hypothetical protein